MERAAYFDIYSHTSGMTKDPRLYDAFTLKSSVVTFVDPEKARRRREILSPFFSRRAILDLETSIQNKVISGLPWIIGS